MSRGRKKGIRKFFQWGEDEAVKQWFHKLNNDKTIEPLKNRHIKYNALNF